MINLAPEIYKAIQQYIGPILVGHAGVVNMLLEALDNNPILITFLLNEI